ncbi:crossover junction endodeoxyribonuclease RuvC [Patescibacteria group bacterium]|nr:crossover junction endodeoxyribonuclease RuvC [Patescibacteria group bacterium]
MIILGIDPGTATTGYALIKKNTANSFAVVDFGVIKTKSSRTDSQRLIELHKDIKKLMAKFKPDAAGVEKLYFETNVKTAMAVSQARGVVLLALEQGKIKTHEFTPLQVKSIICGYGKADKRQVQMMVQKTFNLKRLPKPDDAADALAIALCAGFKKL